MSKIIREACVDTLNDALTAATKGVERIELCSNLDQDGLTPEFTLAKSVISSVDIPVRLMIRTRAGNFNYNTLEIKEMIRQIDQLKPLKPDGFVLGALTENCSIDIATTTSLVMACRPLPVTFHKAIDESPDLIVAIQDLMNINGISHILTSGGKATANEGAETIRNMLLISKNHFTIIAAGKITADNLAAHVAMIGVNEYHGKKIV
ncbi:MAG: hypothetical protein JXQ90_21370 [Cyclobacteriaceae bacterium]